MGSLGHNELMLYYVILLVFQNADLQSWSGMDWLTPMWDGAALNMSGVVGVLALSR